MYDLFLTEEARRYYDRAETALVKKLNRCFDQIQADPFKHPNIKRLKGQLTGYLRYRVGDWRVVYQVDDQAKQITVLLTYSSLTVAASMNKILPRRPAFDALAGMPK